MEKFSHKILYSVWGAAGGISGLLSLGRCPGNTCTSCFGCAGAGIGILLLLIVKWIREKRKGECHGVA